MIIKNIYGTTQEKIANKEHNLYLGISLGNKFFTKDAIEEYLRWVVENTKEKPIVLLADSIQAYNYMAFRGYDVQEASAMARCQSFEYRNMVQKVVNRLKNNKEIDEIDIIGIEDVLTKEHLHDIKFLENEIEKNIEFKDTIYNLMKETLINKDLNENNFKIASKYILSEIPIQFNLKYNGIQYDLYPYPGNKVTQLFDKLQNREIFPEIRDQLSIPTKFCSVEAYV